MSPHVCLWKSCQRTPFDYARVWKCRYRASVRANIYLQSVWLLVHFQVIEMWMLPFDVFFACWYLFVSLPLSLFLWLCLFLSLTYTYLFNKCLWRVVKWTAFLRCDVERHLLFPSCNKQHSLVHSKNRFYALTNWVEFARDRNAASPKWIRSDKFSIALTLFSSESHFDFELHTNKYRMEKERERGIHATLSFRWCVHYFDFISHFFFIFISNFVCVTKNIQ